MPFNPMPAIAGQKTWQAQPDDYTTSITAAATITLPDIGYRLVRVVVETGATPGSLSIAYDGIAKAHFPTGSNGTNGTFAWAVLWAFRGTNIASTLFTFNGGLTRATLTFSKGKSMAPDITQYTAIRFTVTTAAVHAAPTPFAASINYDVAPAVPTGLIAVATTVGYSFQWPVVGTGASGGAADSQPSAVSIHLAPTLPKATSLTMSYTNTVAVGTLDLYVGYDPK